MGLSIGVALMDSLDDMIRKGIITPQLALKIMSNFDRGIAEVLASKVKARLTFKVWIFPFYFLPTYLPTRPLSLVQMGKKRNS